MAWTPERVDQLRLLAQQNLSANDMGYRLGVSRNSIIGKCLRMGIKLPQAQGGGRPNGGRPRAPAAQPRGVTPQRRVPWRPSTEATAKPPRPIETVFASDAEIPLAQRRTLLELETGECKWPCGEGEAMFFCGGFALENRSYCAAHYRRSTTKYEITHRNFRLF